jgi:hypothetical protein
MIGREENMRRLAICRLLVIFVAGLVASGSVEAQVKPPVNPPATTPAKRHQATGTIATSTATQLVLLKTFGRNQARWNFVLNPRTKIEGKLTKGVRARIYYYNDAKGQRVAEEIKILAPASPAVAKAPASASAPAAPVSSATPPQPH